MRVLVVDHSDAVRSRLVARLGEASLDVFAEVGTVADGLAQAARAEAIVVDVLFPDWRGPEVVRALREQAPRAILIVLTNAMHYRRPCLEQGADHFLDKSTDLDVVIAILVR